MSLVINTNTAATQASLNLARSNTAQQASLNRLSSGSRIVNPADDAGGLAVSMKLSAAARRQGAASANIANTVSYLQTQDGALSVTGKILNRISELKTLSTDPTKSTSDIANYNSEFGALQKEIQSIGAEKFNGVGLFSSTALSTNTSEDQTQSVSMSGINLLGASGASPAPSVTSLAGWNTSGSVTLGSNQINLGPVSQIDTKQSYSGPVDITFDYHLTGNGRLEIRFGGAMLGQISTLNADYTAHITLDGSGGGTMDYGNGSGDIPRTGVPTSGVLSIMSINGSNGIIISGLTITGTADSGGSGSGNINSVATATDLASLSLDTVTGAIKDVATYRAQNGANQSRLGFATELLTTNKANLEAANSRISDVDVAEESTVLAKNNVLVQAGTAMLQQANQATQGIVRLLS